MGLDWNPLPRPRPGHEAEFDRILAQRAASDDDALQARFLEISQLPCETLDAAQVGTDVEADEWLRTQVGHDKYDEARGSMDGYYVLDLLPPCDGFPVYSNHGLYEGLDRYSFRAQFLHDVHDVLGAPLYERAYETMSAEQLRVFSEDLLRCARDFARAHGVEHVERMRDVVADEGSAAARAHVIFAAAKWCLYWADRGHGLEPWF